MLMVYDGDVLHASCPFCGYAFDVVDGEKITRTPNTSGAQHYGSTGELEIVTAQAE
jgi:hypothetical protein